MKILAIEFSSPQRSVAVFDQRHEANETPPRAAADMPPPRPVPEIEPTSPPSGPTRVRVSLPVTQALTNIAEVVESGANPNAFAIIEQALRECGTEREQIECIALGIGPGSYTGIRAAIALAQGWQLATEVKLLAISSVEAIVAQAAGEGLAGPAAVVIDAQRGEFYLSEWKIDDGACVETGKLRLATLAEVDAAGKAGHLFIGPEVAKWFPQGRIVYPRAAALARLAASRNDFIAGESIEPIYLRPVSFVKAPPPRKLPD